MENNYPEGFKTAEQLQELELKKGLTAKSFLPLLLQIVNLALFFYIIPAHIAERYDILFAIIGGFSTMFLCFWIVVALTPIALDKAPVVTALLCISTLFIFGFTFLKKTTSFGSEQLAKHAVLVEARIVDKTKIYGKRGRTIKYMDVKFYDKNKNIQEATINLSDQEYNKYQRGRTVMIYYSSEHPNIARIAYNKQKY